MPKKFCRSTFQPGGRSRVDFGRILDRRIDCRLEAIVSSDRSRILGGYRRRSLDVAETVADNTKGRMATRCGNSSLELYAAGQVLP